MKEYMFDISVPLGEINADFYRHIYKGQRGSLRPRQQQHHHQQQQQLQQQQRFSAAIHPSVSVAENDNEPHWQCHLCTFRNHPLMNKCEQCEMPRVLLGNIVNAGDNTAVDGVDEEVLYSRRQHAANSNPPLFGC